MIVRLLVNLKVENGSIEVAGSEFSNENGADFPDYIKNNLENPKIIKVVKADPSVPVVSEEGEKDSVSSKSIPDPPSSALKIEEARVVQKAAKVTTLKKRS